MPPSLFRVKQKKRGIRTCEQGMTGKKGKTKAECKDCFKSKMHRRLYFNHVVKQSWVTHFGEQEGKVLGIHSPNLVIDEIIDYK